MRLLRGLVGAATLAAVLVGLSSCGVMAAGAARSTERAAPAGAHSGVWVEVSPNNITPGFSIQVRASCGDNSNPATVVSKAFGTVTVQPWNSLLLAEVTVPASTNPGRFDVTITCKTGSTATTSLTVVGSTAAPTVAPTVGPHTGGGFLAAHPQNPGGIESPALLWLGIGGLSLVGAAAVAARAVRTSRRRRPAEKGTPARVHDPVA